MKKILSVLIFILMTFSIKLLNEYNINATKIGYESLNGDSPLSVSDEIEASTILDKVSIIAKLSYDEFTYPEFNRNNSNYKDATMEEVNAYRDAKRRAGRAYHYIKNFLIFSSLNINNYEYAYVCSLLPFVQITFDNEEYVKTKEEILGKLTSHRDIAKVIIREGQTDQEGFFQLAIGEAWAGDVYDRREYTGDGVTVGILETGIVDSTNAILSNQNITYYDQPNFNETVTEHATMCASLIGGKQGMAPDVNLLSAAVNGNIYQEIEWMVNNGADIINMSYGETVPTGIYSSDSAFIDNMVKTYNVVAVAAVGNCGDGSGYVGNPALGYNVIGVGAADMHGDVCDFSSYKVERGPNKPTVVTSGYCLTIPGFSSGNNGTSFSAAFLSGMLATLLDAYPDLKTRTEMVIAMTCASAYHQPGYSTSQANGFNTHNGAGRFNLQDTMDNYYKIWTFNNAGGSNGLKVYEFSAYVSEGYDLQASFAWLATANVSSATASYNSYEARLINQNGELMAIATSDRSNVLFMYHRVTTEGRYTMQIYQRCNTFTGTDKLAFAYSIENNQ